MPSKSLTIGELQHKLATDPRSLTLDELRAIQELERIKRQKQDEGQKPASRESVRDVQYEQFHDVIFSKPNRKAPSQKTLTRKRK